MSSHIFRIGRGCLWGVAATSVVFATAVATLRVALPQITHFKPQIQDWVENTTGIKVEMLEVSGTWHNYQPSLALTGVNVTLPNTNIDKLAVDELYIELDVLDSLRSLSPIAGRLTINGLQLDLRSYDFFDQQAKASNAADTATDANATQPNNNELKWLDTLLLRQFEDFTITNSNIWYNAVSGESRLVDIESLRWHNQEKRHQVEATISIDDADLNALLVSADFSTKGSLANISGDFYLSAKDVSIEPWLKHTYLQDVGVKDGSISLNSWLTLDNSKPVDAYVELLPSDLIWQQEHKHELVIERGILHLSPLEDGIKVSADSLALRTDYHIWPELDIAFQWQPDAWNLNLSQLDIEALLPLVDWVPDSDALTQELETLAPKGKVQDIRLGASHGFEDIHYSAQLEAVGLSHKGMIPGFEQLQGSLFGDLNQAKLNLNIVDDVLAYDEVFQAPLKVKQAEVDMVWQRDEAGWRLWSDKITAATPDIQVLGAFRLDFPKQASPFLSFYTEADLYNAGETWRYLPTPALGADLTDYLSSAIQGGSAKTAKLLWFGELAQFPYQNHNGIFQAEVELKEAKFSFDTAWPAITQLQIDLLFENNSLYLDSRSAMLEKVKGHRITGVIPQFKHIEVKAHASGFGNDVRDYMMATPLVDSVGAALTTLQVSGEVHSEFELNIPFNRDKQARAWGFADLKGNRVDIKAPAMTLEQVSGRVEFDNDLVSTKGLQAQLLDQPIQLDFNGESASSGYKVDIATGGDWAVAPLVPYLDEYWLSFVSGHASWEMGIDLQLNDIGFNYQIDVLAQMDKLASEYPYPLTKPVDEEAQAVLHVLGDQEQLLARLELLDAKYQTEIDITGDVPILESSYLLLGDGEFQDQPLLGHYGVVDLDKFDLAQWLEMKPDSDNPSVSETSDPVLEAPALVIPHPTRWDVAVDTLSLGTIDLHEVELDILQQGMSWQFDLASREASGKASYLAPYDLAVLFEHLHLNIPQAEAQDIQESEWFEMVAEDEPEVTDLERNIYQQMPNLTLSVNDFWLQGYKVGKVNVDLQRKNDRLLLQQANIVSGDNKIEVDGWWSLNGNDNTTSLNVAVEGENNSDVMERFGITSGIQEASFKFASQTQWQGSPWAMQIDTLQGNASTEFGKGTITGVGGAVKLLGLFSLDSILRKMQLDFSDVFAEGMAFDSISGTARIDKGIFYTNDLEMDALAGEMQIRGLANLNDRTIDADVQFSPDLTSGLPTLTAFTVAPQVALYVWAISTAISPVVEVFTQVNYHISGPIDAPEVSETSRSRAEVEVPENLRKKNDK